MKVHCNVCEKQTDTFQFGVTIENIGWTGRKVEVCRDCVIRLLVDLVIPDEE